MNLQDTVFAIGELYMETRFLKQDLEKSLAENDQLKAQNQALEARVKELEAPPEEISATTET